MTPEQIDLTDHNIAEIIQRIGYCKIEIFLQGNPVPITGEYQRLDKRTVMLHNGLTDRYIIDVNGIAAIGVRS